MVEKYNSIFDVDNPYSSMVSDGMYTDGGTYIDSGSYIVNAVLTGSIYGGYPTNTITALAGESSVGKTFLCIDAIKKYQESYPEGMICWFDSEGGIDSNTFQSRGVDTKRIMVYPVGLVNQFSKQIHAILDGYKEIPLDDRKGIMFVLDSLGQLSSDKEMIDAKEGTGKQDYTRAKLIKAVFRQITLTLASVNCPLLVTNHVYIPIGQMFPQPTMSGGTGLKYAASNIILLGKSKQKDGSNIIGTGLRVKMDKSRSTQENKIVKSRILFETGFDRYYGLVEFATDNGIFESTGTKRKIPGFDKPVFEKSIYKEPEKYFTKEVLDLIDDSCHKYFMFGNAYSMWKDAKDDK